MDIGLPTDTREHTAQFGASPHGSGTYQKSRARTYLNLQRPLGSTFFAIGAGTYASYTKIKTLFLICTVTSC